MPLTRNQLAALNSVAVNREFMRRTGLTRAGDRLWTDAEVEILTAHLPAYDRLAELLPGRTRQAIAKKAGQLGLTKSRRVWRAGQVTQMRKPYVDGAPVPGIAEDLGDKTKFQVWGKASQKRYRRPRRPPKLCGIPLVDDVRRRAFEMNITMRELDEMMGGNGYFCRPQSLRPELVQRAVRRLGGRFDMTWRGA